MLATVLLLVDLSKRVLAECATPVYALFVDPAAAFLGVGDLEDIATLEKRLFVHLFCALRDFGGDVSVANTLGDTSFPCLKGLAGVVVDDKVFVGLVNTRGEGTAEPQAADLGDILEAGAALVFDVVFGDVVLREAVSVLCLPDRDVDGHIIVIHQMLEPKTGVARDAALALVDEFEDDGGSVAVLHGKSEWCLGKVESAVVAVDMAYMSRYLAAASSSSHADLGSVMDVMGGDVLGRKSKGTNIPSKHLGR